MNNYFNINRYFFYLIKELYLVFNKYVFIGLAIFLLSFLALYKGGLSQDMLYQAFLFMVVYIGGSVLASVLFYPAKDRSNNIFYFTTPVSTIERFLVIVSILYIIYPLMMIGYLSLTSLVVKALNGWNEGFSILKPKGLLELIKIKEVGQTIFAYSVYMAAGLFLRKQVFIKIFVGYFLLKGVIGFLSLKFSDAMKPVQTLFDENIWVKLSLMVLFFVITFIKLKNSKI